MVTFLCRVPSLFQASAFPESESPSTIGPLWSLQWSHPQTQIQTCKQLRKAETDTANKHDGGWMQLELFSQEHGEVAPQTRGSLFKLASVTSINISNESRPGKLTGHCDRLSKAPGGPLPDKLSHPSCFIEAVIKQLSRLRARGGQWDTRQGAACVWWTGHAKSN